MESTNQGKIDLHLHSNMSDGIFSPKKLIRKCHEYDLNAVALTDHETTEGIDEAKEAGFSCGIEVISGVEISVGYFNRELHILGYMNNNFEKLQKKLQVLREGRFERMEKMIFILNQHGISINLEEIKEEAGRAAPGRLHIARLMVRKGYVNSLKESFVKYLGRDCPSYIPRTKLHISEAIKLLNDCGALSVLAHPGITNESYESLCLFKEMGLKGLEVFHPEHSSGLTTIYKNIALSEGFLISGGSDYHGDEKASCQNPGCVSVDYKYLDSIKNFLGQHGAVI